MFRPLPAAAEDPILGLYADEAGRLCVAGIHRGNLAQVARRG